jgi:hypothetical protein
MKSRLIVALLLTIVMLVIARVASTRHAREIVVNVENLVFSHHTVTESFEEGPVVKLTASDASKERAVIYFSETKGSNYQALEMPVESNVYAIQLPKLEKGQKWWYHIDVYKDNLKIATIPQNEDQFIKFKGHVSSFILIPHIFCMFATIFFGILTVFTAVDAVRGNGEIRRSVWFALLAFLFGYAGGIPLGIEVTRQTFGEGWGGWPIGNDWTDTKTEIFLLFWLVTLVLSFNGLRGKKMMITEKTYAFMVILSLVVTFITFLIPHSI